jgi:hypothetical protein
MDEYPVDLKLATWEKKKGALPAKHAIAETLKGLQRKHDAVDWKAAAPGWAKAAKTEAELDKLHGALDKTLRAAVAALKKDATEAVADAQALAAAKGAEKAQVDAGKAIGLAAKAYLRALEAAVDDLQKAGDTARAALPPPGGDDEDDPKGKQLLDPKRLLAQLQACLRNPELRVQFAFVDAKDKQPPGLAMHPKNAGRGMFAKLQEIADVKAGAYGTAWIEGKVLNLMPEKNFSGLVKKARLPIKNAGFRVASIVIWSADGTVLERDDAAEEDDASGDGTKTGGGDAGREKLKLVFATQLKELQPALVALASGKLNNPDAARLASEMTALNKAGDLAGAAALLVKIKALLGGGGGDGDFPARWAAARQAWQDASDKVDGQIGRLQARLREETADADLQRIAEFGLNAVTGGHKVPLMAAMRDIGNGESVDPAILADAREAVADFIAHLNDDERVAACDENPFGVPVTLRSSLVGALEKMAAALGR